MVNRTRQRLLFDTDAFCKLGVAGLLLETMRTFNVTVAECGRLPALPFMLRRGGLRRKFGNLECDRLIDLSQEIPIALQPSDEWLEPLASQASIDPGEALLLATSAEQGCYLITGDKRGLLGITKLPKFVEALNGRVVVPEAMVSALCLRLGVNSIRARIQPLMTTDTAMRVSFSDLDLSPLIGLSSYYDDLAASLAPLNLWSPQ